MQNIIVLFFAIYIFLFTGCTAPVTVPQHTLPKSCAIYDMKQARCIDPEQFAERLAPYGVLFVGDHHQSRALHDKVAGLIDALGESGRHILLANEWFTPVDNTLLAKYSAGSFDGNFTEAIDWEKKAGYPFASYEGIYQSVIRHDGILYGVNMDKTMQKAISDNNLSAFSETQRRFLKTLDMNLTAHRDMLAPFFAHCHAKKADESTSECLERMYRVQVAWDSYMGEQSARLADTGLHDERDLLIVFAGAMHFDYGVGINARFARWTNTPFVTMLPAPKGVQSVDAGEADFVLIYPVDEKAGDAY